MKTLTIKDIEIGQGIPKVIAPIVEKTKEDILEKAHTFNGLEIDIVEWRVDYYEDALCIKEVLDIIKNMRSIVINKLIVFTFRTKKEGGVKTISKEEYTALNKAVAESADVDLIDIEILSGDNIAMENIVNIHNAGVKVIGSSHDFHKTPDEDEIIFRLRKMQDMGVDLCKIAVMPQTPKDVLTLLSATNQMHIKYSITPIITMSMGPLGLVSRISGEIFGSAMTYGAVGQGSAPGQIQIEELTPILDTIHKSVCEYAHE